MSYLEFLSISQWGNNDIIEKMLIFITSLKHPKVTKNVQNVYQLLDRSLRSIENQTKKDFLVLVVCHEIPILSKKYEFVKYLITDLAPPAETPEELMHHGGETSQEKEYKNNLIRLDRWKKYLDGLYFSKQYKPTHVMFFDADDYISSKIVETVTSGPKEKSWVIDKGYIWWEHDKYLVKTNKFHKICGTCFIYSMYIFSHLPVEKNEVEIDWYKDFLGGHVQVPSLLEKQGVILWPLPYHWAIYVINNWENHSANKKKFSFLIGRREILFWFIKIITSVIYLSKKIRKDFAIR